MINIFLLYLWQIPLILFHEFGHALAARILGFRILSISLGSGPQIFERSILGLKLRISLFPFSGITSAVPRTFSHLRLRLWLFVLAGPVTHLVLILICYLMLSGDFFRDRLLSKSLFSISSIAPMEMFIFANLLLILSSLFTKRIGNSDNQVYGDGYQLLTIPFLKEQEEIERYKILHIGIEAHEHVQAGRLEEAITLYENALRANPQSYLLRHDLAVAHINQGSYEQARREFIELLNWEEANQPGWRVVLLNNIAWTDLMLREENLLAEADKYSEEVIKLEPKTTTFIGTRGAVLVRTGRVQEGLDLLKVAFKKHSKGSSRAGAACWIAIGAAKSGNLSESTNWLQKARDEYPEHHFLQQAEEEVKAALSFSTPLVKSLSEVTPQR